MDATVHQAPDWSVSQWFNIDKAITLEQLRGKVVVLHAFQMLCPGCVSHGLPQAQRLHDYFSKDDVIVIGLHTVFEHHAAMTPTSLKAFIHEYRLSFPIGVDTASANADTPVTMTRYEMRGTPNVCLIDREGMLRANYFGRPEDLQIGAEISALVNGPHTVSTRADSLASVEGCTDEGCKI
ncbi:MAG: redoxin domain-containing protein [Gammaproteobacteria bacterium]|nr:redoxin domain-containing protein [Gammaproteobacteria bacterium]